MTTANHTQPFISRVTLRNYKSIAACQVDLQALTFLVGPNGAGKSNFLDALRFVADALRTSLEHALRERGGIGEVRRRTSEHANHFAVRLDFALPDGRTGHYSVSVGAKPAGKYEVQNEECAIQTAALAEQRHFYHIKAGTVTNASLKTLPAVLPDRLFLVAASGLPEFRPVFDALSRVEVYNLNPRVVALPQPPDPSGLLRRDGSNAASVLQQIDADSRERINAYLARVVPGFTGVKAKTLGAQETVEFRQNIAGKEVAWPAPAFSLSDGTLRAFGILLAVFQSGGRRNGHGPLLIGIEEPELALHPAASSILLAALREAAQTLQIVVTSHSPDLLDNPNIPTEALLAVENETGLTRIGPIDVASREVLKQNLFTAGELLRQNQLAPDARTLVDVSTERQLNLFELNGR